jgi:two-component system NtrC family sensor kinase
MHKDKLKDASLHSILQNNLRSSEPDSGTTLEEEKVKQALLRRPSFSVKARLILIFVILFLISAGASLTAMFMVSRIDYHVQFVTLVDGFANEIQQVRRIEKNFLLYGSDLSEATEHLDNAGDLLNRTAQELGHVVSRQELDSIDLLLTAYQHDIDTLIVRVQLTGFKESEDFRVISQSLRNHGSEILELSLDASRKERQMISATTRRAVRIHFVLLGVLLVLSIFVAVHIYRHIILRLNRLLEATQRFASGDFLPITPKRRYRDEFSHLVIALNHMMYELDRRQNLLMESHKLRAIGNLTAGVAHELNNPLNNIILTTAVLQDSYHDLSDEELDDIVNDLVVEGERAQRVVKNLLDFARESETKTEYFHVDQLVEGALNLARNQIKLSKIKLECRVEPNLPPLYGDQELLKQVFLNLIINAIDAMPNGGVLSVDVAKESKTGFVAIQVSDTGCGIPKHILDSVFNPFFTTKPTGKGTGLGLAVSRGIIEKHGGDIKVESKDNEGARFIVYLPIVPIPADIGIDKDANSQDERSGPD